MRLFHVFLFLLLGFGLVAAEDSSPSTAPLKALPVDPADLNPVQLPQAIPGGVNIHWYGHGFIYLTSSVGIRAAIDPFGPQTVHYQFPTHLSADIVLITNESEDHCAADQIFGDPLIFRSVMAVGLNRANGIEFHGVSLQKDPSGQGGANTAFVLKFDNVTFCYLGQIAQPLLATEKQQLGHVDVLFLPVGVTSMSVDDLNQVARDVAASVIVPVNYKTDQSGDLPLRGLDEYLATTKFPVRKVSASEMVISRGMLPSQPTIYVMKSP
ncbi:MAG: MBL fold metallo-hydrolase [Methylacidiphilales bacterium]|nr:MBL fold metallo-hydrolase [Candidatus Methylacidiphilales bacterium]